MISKSLYCAGTTAAAGHAARFLRSFGYSIADQPGWDTEQLLLDVPSFQGKLLRGGGNPDTLLQSLPREVIIWGGNLDHPALDGFRKMDLLKDEEYLVENAAITARCALKLITPMRTSAPEQSPALIIGWGRIGKHLAELLKSKGYPLVVAARNPRDRAQLESLGYRTADPAALEEILGGFRILINTAPAPVLDAQQMSRCEDCIKMDLASRQGIAGRDVIHARGLPGIHAPECSGKLIAETILRLSKEVCS